MMRVPAGFTKTGKVRFISHRDVARVERTLRRAELPVAYWAVSRACSALPAWRCRSATRAAPSTSTSTSPSSPVSWTTAALAAPGPPGFTGLLPTGVAVHSGGAVGGR